MHIIYFLVLWDHWTQFENKSSTETGARGRGQRCTITLLHINRLNKTESAIFVSLVCYLLLEDLHSELILMYLLLLSGTRL